MPIISIASWISCQSDEFQAEFKVFIMQKKADQTIIEEIAVDLEKVLGISKKPLKHHMVGIESEFMILDSSGRVANDADAILKASGNAVKKECAKNMLEIDALPSRAAGGTMQNTLDRTQQLLDVMEKTEHNLYFCGTYPGKFTPVMRTEEPYNVKREIFGERFPIAGRCIGFHCHYTLPRGMLDYLSRRLKIFVKSKISQSLIGSYNMIIAMDPALTAFAQSSPYYQGKMYGKDARMMFYRGSRIFGVDGLYTDYQDFGALPEYKHTLVDIMHLVEDRFREWTVLVRRLGINVKTLALYGSVLDTNWSPVKINPIGTFEVRGMDMSRFETLASLSAVIKYVLKSINENYITVVDSDIAIKEPFRVEGHRIFIPPYSYVHNILQRDSALYGMQSPSMRFYCSRLLKLAAKTMPRNRRKFLRPLKRMIDRKCTLSDEIILKARRMGYRDTISDRGAAELALKISGGVQKDIEKTRRFVAQLE